MRTIEFDNNSIVIYQSAEELPIMRYARFQRYCILDSGVGSTMDDIGKHFGKLFEFLSHNMNEEAVMEAKNLYYNYFIILEDLSLNGMAFASLIYSINGKVITDYSEDNLRAVINELDEIGLKAGVVLKIKEEVKKKFTMT